MAFTPSSCPCFGCAGGSANSFSFGDSSQNGWPADKDPSKVDIITVSVPGLKKGKQNIQVARKAAPQIVSMIQFWDAQIEPVKLVGVYNWREIRGQEGTGHLSNHASGTAVDINWDKHPLGAEPGKDGLTDAQRALISAKAAELGLRWGGNYRGRKDSMHTELPGGAVAVLKDPLSLITGGSADDSAGTSGYTKWLYLGAIGLAGVLVYRKYKGKPPIPPAITQATGIKL